MWTTEFLTQAGAFAVVGALVILAMLVSDRDNSTRFFLAGDLSGLYWVLRRGEHLAG
ncbi:hypothetical protein [Faecalibacterium hattorii]|uniref:hypothetical protein n=1 Tax=Faecalibacterium hattorii TaxID=2935520 RepID=UPI0015EBB3D0|nr:hypothetical protein [Faecalibacterium hattorii]